MDRQKRAVSACAMDALLPDEIWIHVFTFGTVEEWFLAGAHRTCRRFAALLRDERLWREWCVRAGTERIGEEPWKAAYARWFERERVYRAVVDERRNVFVTGGAGVGKSHVLKEMVRRLRALGRRVTVTAATGIAALQIGGTTLHSFAGAGAKENSRQKMIGGALANPEARRRWKETHVLVVDEISMISPVYLAAIDTIARRLRGIYNIAFGGIQLIFFGDFFQLPPVSASLGLSATLYCFETNAWHDTIQKTIELKSAVRQVDGAFCELLDRVRTARLTLEDISLLRSREGATLNVPEGVEPTRLFPHRKSANKVNCARLSELKTEERKYEGFMARETYTRSSDVLSAAMIAMGMLCDNCPAPRELSLKVGAQVMLVVNLDPGAGLVNGSVGKVIGFAPITHFPTIAFSNGVCTDVGLYTWTSEDPDGKWTATYRQFPLILAWAVTIHKCQGTTLDAAEMDLENVFEDGQAYVALSRLRSLDGLRLLSFDPKRVRANPRVVEYYRNMRDDSGSGKRKRKLELEADKRILTCRSKRTRVPDEYCHK